MSSPGLVGVVSATGGIQALEEILSSLTRGFPLPILLIPSIHPDYASELAARLSAKSLLEVVIADNGEAPTPGKAYIADSDSCLTVVHGRLRVERRYLNYNRHPKDALFHSMALDQGPGAVAVILAGLGDDGAAGMKEVRDAGGHTIVQDRSTSLVYGAADLAMRLDAACESLPLEEIAPRLLTLAAGDPPNPGW
jgi:two-component system chemotaxis response regulator CheB